jgi:hypothetical protein
VVKKSQSLCFGGNGDDGDQRREIAFAARDASLSLLAMNKPLVVNLPHKLGAEEAKRRMRSGIGKLGDHIPGGGQVESGWEGNRMKLRVQAMGQEVSGHIDVEETKVRLELMLPPILSLFAGKIEGLLRSRGSELLEDKTKKS